MAVIVLHESFKVDGVLTDVTSAKLSDPTGTYGVKRNDTDAVVVADGTAMTKQSTGVYTYTFTEPTTDLVYTYYVEWVYDGETYWDECSVTGMAADTGITEICCAALELIGGESITYAQYVAASTTEARLCKRFYEPIRDFSLRSHPWNCAVTRVELTVVDGEEPAFGFSYYYDLPADCLRVLNMEDLNYTFEIEGRRLLTDETTAKIRYIKKETDVTQYDPLLVEVITINLALKLAGKLAPEDTKIKQRLLEQLHRIVLPAARSADGQESPSSFIYDNSFIDVRR